jgi:hypothetical protein
MTLTIPFWIILLGIILAAILLRIFLPRIFAEFLRRLDITIIWFRSCFDDPVASNKGSMARICAFLALVGGIWTTAMTVRFAFAALAQKTSDAAMLGILAGLATTMLGTVCFGLLRRTTSSGVTETIDDVLPQPSSTDITVKTSTGKTP